MDRPVLLEHLCSTAQRIFQVHEEMSMVKAQERQAKVRTYFECGLDTTTARNRAADQAALDLTTEFFRLDGELAAETEKESLLRLLLGE